MQHNYAAFELSSCELNLRFYFMGILRGIPASEQTELWPHRVKYQIFSLHADPAKNTRLL